MNGANIKVRLRFGFDPKSGLIDLGSFVPFVDAAVARAKVVGSTARVEFRGKVVEIQSAVGGNDVLRALLRSKLMKEFITTDVSVDVSGFPDGEVARRIESTIDDKVFDALIKQLNDGSGQGWAPGRACPRATRRRVHR